MIRQRLCRQTRRLCLLLALMAPAARGQEVSGVVVEGEANRRVPDITVVIASLEGRIGGAARTDEQGAFSIKLPKGGRYVLRALRMGYKPTELLLTLDDTTSMRVEFELTTNSVEKPTLLAPVVVRGRNVDLPARLLEFYDRAERRHGSIFTREDFALTNNFGFALSSIPGVRINARGTIVFQGCARIQLYINGSRFSAPGDTPNSVLQLVAPAEVELMEVYTHVNRIPPEYLNDFACAVIAVWTK